MSVIKELLTSIEQKNKQIREVDKTIKSLQAEEDDFVRQREKLQWRYRRESVCRVLDYVRDKARNGDIDGREIDTLLCHCQNKLNGNIDGTELEFDGRE